MTGSKDQITLTQDYFYKRKVIVFQHKRGYRFSIDAPLLADFLPFQPTQSALEIGTGSGIIALLALYQKKFANVCGIEIQDRLGELALKNARSNGFSQILTVIIRDFKEIYQDFNGVPHIFANPPYYETRRGHLSPNPEIRDAKSETRLTLKELLTLCQNILGKWGNLYLVLPYTRYQETLTLAGKTGLYPTRIREVLSFKGGKPDRFLVQLSNYPLTPEILTPLIIFQEKGVYTREMEHILSGETVHQINPN